ncbi:MAG TPA: S41 family peptidase [Chryseosolibacter sp.]|nr:S41 family peptidase [Chryseosolibacter sp.]
MKIPFLFALFILALTAFGQQKRDFGAEAYQLKNFLLKKHISPRTIDDEFSEDVLTKLLHDLDPYFIHFADADIKALGLHTFSIDNEINNAEWKFAPAVTELYQHRLQESIVFLETISAELLTLDKQDSFILDPGAWSSESELQKRRIQWLKFEVIQKIRLLADRDSTSISDLKSNFQRAVSAVRKSQIQNLNRILNFPGGFEDYVAIAYFQALTAVFDPHTIYLSHKDVNSFIGQLATEDYFFGFTIGENEIGEVSIVALAPGGPAWKSGEIHVSDVLLSAKGSNDQIADFTGLTNVEANELFDVIEDATVEFRFRKKDGTEKYVTLSKEKMQSDESAVRSFVLHGPKKVGYIHLPDFYTRWGSDSEGSRCANDVAKEIFKLKRDGIDALILDVRFNGGGSLYEAMSMAGIFIDEGPVGIIKDHSQKVTTLKDVNRGTVYDGPFVLMVNGQSASASEVLAAAVQDYNRGVVVGGQTYGKATGQQIFPISSDGDETDIVTSVEENGGFVKVTTERLYRITGQSVQGTGVTPDVILPDIFEALNYNESHNPFFLQPDTLAKKTAYKALREIDHTSLRNKSFERVTQSPQFSFLQKEIDRNKADHRRSVCVCWDEVLTIGSVNDQPDGNAAQIFEVHNNSTDEKRLALDEYARAFNTQWKSRLTDDIYLREAFLVATDLIDLTSH